MKNESVPIPKTKFYIPARRLDRVDRQRLIALMDELLRTQKRLTLVSARAGAGKTTLVSEWLRLQERPAAWLSLDTNDNDPHRFITGLLEALHLLGIIISDRIWSELEAPRLPQAEILMTDLINELADSAPPFILVFDDYHLIQNDWIQKAVSFLIEQLPPTIHLILISRVDPQLPLALLRGRGQLTEIRDRDLQFTEAEADQFFNRVMDLGLPAKSVTVFEQRTEGWIAGLQMAGISMQSRKQGMELNAFIEAFSGTNRYILDYLIDEVLGGQPPEIQAFLLETSILDRLCGDLCDAVRADAVRPGASQAILLQMEHNNLFVVSLDDDRRWYRYHHLFADLLKNNLGKSRTNFQIRELHHRASQWFLAQGALDEAMMHSMAAQDFERAAAIIDENIDSIFTRGNPPLLLSWIKDLPEEILRSRPWMDVYYANTLAFLGQLDEVDPLLDAAERRIAPDNPRRAETLGHITAVRAYAANLRGNGTEAIRMASLSKGYLNAGRPAIRAMVAYILADTYFAGDDMQNAAQELSDLLNYGEKTDQVLMVVTALCSLAAVKKVEGRLRQAEKLFDRAFQWISKQDRMDLRVRCGYEFGLADLLREWNQLDAALDLALTASERLHRLGGYLVDFDLGLMRIYQARGETESAFECLHKAEKDIQTYQFQLTTMTEFRTARVEQWLAVGEVETATRWAEECTGGSEKEQITLARLRLAQGRVVDAQRLLDPQHQLAETGERTGRLIEILALQAIALDAQGNSAKADAALAKALFLAYPEGFQRVFLDLRQPLEAIQKRLALRSNTDPILSKEQGKPVSRAHSLADTVNDVLTSRELDVLRLLAEGLSNKDMAVRLVVAPSTIKQHLKNICRKLGVHNRTQAVARGRALNLL